MDFKENEPESLAAIILAAGGSHRFGKTKQVLMWKGDNFINTVIQSASEAGLAPIVVVLGAEAQKVAGTIMRKDLRVVINTEWEQGQSSSIKQGIQILLKENPNAMGAVFFQVDQPQTPLALLELIKKEASSGAQIVAPLVQGEMLSPVYFSKHCFDSLKQIEGDRGGKTIFPFFEVKTVAWQDERQSMDVDTPEDYDKLRKLYGINGRHLV